MGLHDTQGQRLYLTAAERAAFLAAAKNAPLPVRTFCLILHYTGCRISEALALTPASIDLFGKTIVFETLKKRRRSLYRAVPVPEAVPGTLNLVHGLQGAGKRRRRARDRTPLWSWSRTTAWRRVKAVRDAAAIVEGRTRHRRACATATGCRRTCSKSGWATPPWRSRPSTPTPSARSSTGSRPGWGSEPRRRGKGGPPFVA